MQEVLTSSSVTVKFAFGVEIEKNVLLAGVSNDTERLGFDSSTKVRLKLLRVREEVREVEEKLENILTIRPGPKHVDLRFKSETL